MIPKGLFTQIGMVIVSIGIIITYIQPAFQEVGATQDNIAVYEEQREKVKSVNSRLATHVSQINSISNNDTRRLLNYMPDKVDTIYVQRDLLLISTQAGVIYNDASYSGDSSRQNISAGTGDEIQPIAYEFVLSVEGSYEQIKNLFSLLEQNHYPLEVKALELTQLEGSFLGADITLVTYQYNNPVTGEIKKIEF
jgi:hypothetical protein